MHALNVTPDLLSSQRLALFIIPCPELSVSTNVATLTILIMLFICAPETIDVVFLELVNAVTENCTCMYTIEQHVPTVHVHVL